MTKLLRWLCFFIGLTFLAPDSGATTAPEMPQSGFIGHNLRWSAYGKYLEHMEDAIQREWENIMLNEPYPPTGSTITITFILNSSGKIPRIVHITASSKCTDIGKRACVSAIANQQPYGKWTDAMVADLGTEQELTFMFDYE